MTIVAFGAGILLAGLLLIWGVPTAIANSVGRKGK